MKTCEGCKYYFKDSWLARLLSMFSLETGTCGTPIIGKTIVYKEKTVKLCGCIMKFKTELHESKCPIEKW